MSRAVRGLILTAVVAVILILCHTHIFYYRDNFTTHYPILDFASSILRSGELPLWNSHVSGGQPLGGNPNTLLFYPTTLLYVFLPSHLAFNLHFVIHLAVAWFALSALARRFGASPEASRWAALLYVGSGVVVSALSFYNLIVAAALMPLALALAIDVVRDRSASAAALLGCTGGLLILAAEPVTLLGLAIIGGATLLRRDLPRSLTLFARSLSIAVVVASPLLIAHGEVSSELERFANPYDAETVLTASAGPLKLLELITGPVRGSALDHGAGGLMANLQAMERPPFFGSVMIGALLLPALIFGWRGERRRLVVAAVVLLFLAIGSWNPIVRMAVERIELLRIARNPEKLLLAFNVVAAVLVAAFLDGGRRDRRGATIAGASLMFLFSAATLIAIPLTSVARTRLVTIVAVGLLTLAFVLIRETPLGRIRAVAILAFAPLLYWFPLLAPVTRSFWFTQPSPLAAELRGRTLFTGFVREDPARDSIEERAFRLTPMFGLSHDVGYALTGSPDGMFSRRTSETNGRAMSGSVDRLVRYLRLQGAERLLTESRVASADVSPLSGHQLGGRSFFVAAVREPRETVTPARRLFRVSDESSLFQVMERPDFDPALDAACVRCDAALAATGRVTSVRAGSQRVEFESDLERAGLIVVNATYFKDAWSVRDESGGELVTLPVNHDRLGVIVPAGRHRVVVSFSKRRALIGSAWGLSWVTLVLCAWLGVRRRSSSREAQESDRAG
jgi:hypothetical protein